MSEDPYPQIEHWRVAARALSATHDALRGNTGREAAVLWLGERAAASVVSSVVHLHGDGVAAGRGFFEATPEVMGVVTRWAKPRGLTLLADLHAHPRGVPGRLSPWDRRHGIAVPEFLAAVAGDGGEDEPGRWGWFVFNRRMRAYRSMPPAERRSRILVDPDSNT